MTETVFAAGPQISYVQMSLVVNKQAAIIVNSAFEMFGALSITITSANDEQLFDVASPVEPQWDRQRLSALFHSSQPTEPILQALNLRLGRVTELEISMLQDQDWERSWLDQFKPIKVGEKLWVCPSWCELVEKDDINLILDPGLAFGTGSHETTQLCLAFIAKAKLSGYSVIDFGCGSGILAIATLLLGADAAFGVDIDSRAVATAAENAIINGVDDRFVALTNVQYDAQYASLQTDMVIANILAHTLITLSGQIKTRVRSGGLLLLSGILQSQVEDVMSEYSDLFKFQIQTRNDWVLLIGQKLDGN